MVDVNNPLPNLPQDDPKLRRRGLTEIAAATKALCGTPHYWRKRRDRVVRILSNSGSSVVDVLNET